jgi:hypothetical protein
MLFQLLLKQPWLQERWRKQGLDSLLHGLCRDLSEQVLVCDLLNRFKFLNSTDRSSYAIRMVKQIVDVWKLSESNTQLVATTMDDEADSSQALLQELKPRFIQYGWSHVQTVNTMRWAGRKISAYPNVVLIDEFSGTGKTINSRIRHLGSELRSLTRETSPGQAFTIRVCLLASMADALRSIAETGVEVFTPIVLEKGISDYYDGENLASATTKMRRLESGLCAVVGDKPLPSFGYGGAEALFSTDANPPNSVFPVFWWPRSADGKKRRTVLTRQQSYAHTKPK